MTSWWYRVIIVTMLLMIALPWSSSAQSTTGENSVSYIRNPESFDIHSLFFGTWEPGPDEFMGIQANMFWTFSSGLCNKLQQQSIKASSPEELAAMGDQSIAVRATVRIEGELTTLLCFAMQVAGTSYQFLAAGVENESMIRAIRFAQNWYGSPENLAAPHFGLPNQEAIDDVFGDGFREE